MSGKLSSVSTRKVAANRQNALKSTGPKTPRGKGYSRGNALKHGLFAMDPFIPTLTEWEDPKKYQELLEGLAQFYQPVGVAEELEVQRIAACWWKHSRAWRYENAEIAFDLVKVERHAELASQEVISSEQPRLDLLRNAAMEIEATGKISDELKGKMFADAGFRKLWELAEVDVNELVAERVGVSPSTVKKALEANPDCSTNVLLATTRRATHLLLREIGWIAAAGGSKIARDQVAIPRAEVLDRVLRAEAATERHRNQAIDQLERLQRRRRGEAVPPPVNVRVSQ
jgi:hypothetical protein